MNVTELNSDQLMQLKWNMFYEDDCVELDERQKNCLRYCEYPEEIPNNLIYEVYGGICFVEEDFG